MIITTEENGSTKISLKSVKLEGDVHFFMIYLGESIQIRLKEIKKGKVMPVIQMGRFSHNLLRIQWLIAHLSQPQKIKLTH